MSSTISSSNYYSVSASSTNGIAGLVSGMDTDSMVKEMLSGTQSKIDAQKQLKQQIEWKQEMYREVISGINTFRDKYFDTSYGSFADKPCERIVLQLNGFQHNQRQLR